MRRTRQWLSMGLALAAVAARPSPAADLRDLYFGEALFQAYQGQYFDALQRLDTLLATYHGPDEPQPDTLPRHSNNVELSVDAFEVDYPMHQRAGRAIKAMLGRAVD